MTTKNHPTVTLVLLLFYLSSIHTAAQNQFSWSAQKVQHTMDSIISAHQNDYLVPGVTYAIVKGDQILALDAKGLADIETKEPMDARNSHFMLGSLSKLVVATAVMKLVETGQLDLDADVNKYLDGFEWPSVSLRQLLTHTAGFEERTFSRLRLKEEKVIPFEQYLKRRMPAQIFPPGSLGAYSNHGVALAGLVVQQVSGQPFEQFVEENIFQPLKMDNASFSLNPESLAGLSTPYLIQKGEAVPTHYEYVLTVPASMLIGTAEDMAHFMGAHLNGGAYKGGRILKNETVDSLQKQHYTAHPDLDGRALAFFEDQYRGRRGLTHGNSRNGFVSYMYLIPEDSLGIFVTINGGRNSFRTKVTYDFLKEVYPETSSTPSFVAAEGLQQYEGTYLRSRRNETTVERIFHQIVLSNEVKVEALADTALLLFNEVYKMEKTGNWSNPAGTFKVAFENRTDGLSILHLPGRSDALVKIPWYGQKAFTIVALGLPLLTFLLLFLGRIFKSLFRRKAKSSPAANYWLGFSLSGFFFFLLFMGSILSIREGIQYGVPGFFYLIFLLPFLSVLFYIIATFKSFFSWNDLSQGGKIFHGYLMIIGIVFLWELYYWNLIGFDF